MALIAYALATLAELKSFMPAIGQAKDPEMERALGLATDDVEAWLNRRLVYRAPTTTEAVVVNAQAFAAGALTVANQPNAAGRTLVVSFSAAKSGTVTVTGTVAGVVGQTETFDAADGPLQYGVKFFTAVSGVSGANPPAAPAGTVTIATSQGYVEFYSPCQSWAVTPIEWPVRYVAEVNEDINRVYSSTTALVATTDYELRRPSSVRRQIARVSAGLEFSFSTGKRVVRARLSAGYKGPAEVPLKIKGVALELAAWYFQHSEGQEYGLSSRSDAMGNRSFSGPPMLTDGMKDRLAGELRPEFDQVGERDFDERAA